MHTERDKSVLLVTRPDTTGGMAASTNWESYSGARMIRALLSGVHIGAPDSWKLPSSYSERISKCRHAVLEYVHVLEFPVGS